MTLLATLSVILSLVGWGSLISQRQSAHVAWFTTVSLAGCLLFLAFLLQTAVLMAKLVFLGGLLLGCVSFCRVVKQSNTVMDKIKQHQLLLGFGLCMLVVILLMAWGMQFGSIDDYSFWGTISRYLYVFKQLPHDDSYINANFLKYTPGLASFHFLFYQAAGFYSASLNYIAQGILLITPILLFINEKQRWQSLALMMMSVILLFLAYGNVFARLEVDASVAIWFFALLWMTIQTQRISWLALLAGVVFLSIIKEIGLLFAIVVIVVDYACHKKRWRTLSLMLGILLMKLAWHAHVSGYGFTSFAASITLSKALNAILPGNPEYVRSQVIFLKEFLSGSFDHILKIPYGALLILSAWQVHRLSRLGRLTAQHWILLKAFAILIPVYVMFLYWLQAIVFRVGYLQPHLLDFSRYFNMAFVPFILTLLFITLTTATIWSYGETKRFAQAATVIAIVFIIGGKIERTHKYYHPYNFHKISANITQHGLKPVKLGEAICMTGVPKPTYQLLMPLNYFLMPIHVVASHDSKQDVCSEILEFNGLT